MEMKQMVDDRAGVEIKIFSHYQLFYMGHPSGLDGGRSLREAQKTVNVNHWTIL
jgi:hypothetical protein